MALVLAMGACEPSASSSPENSQGADARSAAGATKAAEHVPELDASEELFENFRTQLASELPPTSNEGNTSAAGDELANAGRSPGLALVPQDCGHEDHNAPYGPVKVGVPVVLGRHRQWQGDDNWNSDMHAFVGKQTKVVSLEGADNSGCTIVHVSLDNGSWVWRIRDMTVPGSGPAPLTAVSKLDPAAEARRERAAKLASVKGRGAVAVTQWVVGPSQRKVERAFVSDSAPVFDADLGLYVIYAREETSASPAWLMLGLRKLESGYYRGDSTAATAVMASLEGSKWDPDAGEAAWSLNPGSYVNLQVDAAVPGELRLSFVAQLASNDGKRVDRIESGYAVINLPPPPEPTQSGRARKPRKGRKSGR